MNFDGRVINKTFNELEDKGFSHEDIKKVYNTIFTCVRFYANQGLFPRFNLKNLGRLIPSVKLLKRIKKEEDLMKKVINRIEEENLRLKRKK